MKHLKFKIAALSLTFLMLSGAVLNARHGRRNGANRYSANRYYDTHSIKIVSGKITKIQTVNGFGYRNYKTIQLTVKANTKTYSVHLGPDWYVNDKVTLKVGDKITVTGSYTKINSKYLLLGRELKKNGTIYLFRRTDGTPYWAGYNRKQNKI